MTQSATQLALSLPGSYDIPEKPGWAGFPNFHFGSTTTPAKLINDLLPTIFVIAGLILFFLLIFGGFTIFLSAGNPEKTKKGSSMITGALVGFLIIFLSYWILQYLEKIFGIKLVG